MGLATTRFIPIALPSPPVPRDVGSDRDGAIEVVLRGGRRLLVGKDFDVASLKRIVTALEEP
jgi:hypothetical protein